MTPCPKRGPDAQLDYLAGPPPHRAVVFSEALLVGTCHAVSSTRLELCLAGFLEACRVFTTRKQTVFRLPGDRKKMKPTHVEQVANRHPDWIEETA